MLILRLRQAEVALQDNRLEEAFQLLSAPDLRSHRRGQTVVQRLAERFEARAQGHLQAGRLPAARLDAQRARQLAGNRLETAGLLAEIERAEAVERQVSWERQQRVAQARRRVEQGDYSVARQLVEPYGDTLAGEIERDAGGRERDFQRHLERARLALDSQAWSDAVEATAAAARIQPRSPQLLTWQQQLTRRMQEELAEALQAGRLDRAAQFAQWLEQPPLREETTSAERQAYGLLSEAGRAVQAADYAAARRALGTARQLLNAPAWLNQSLQLVESLIAARQQLGDGPLGLLLQLSVPAIGREGPRANGRAARWAGGEVLRESPAREALAAAGPPAAVLPGERFVMHVGHGPSVLVLTRPRVRIGGQGSSRQLDLQLLGIGQGGEAVVERIEDDYFLTSEDPVSVNGQQVTSTLLNHGDRVVLGGRGGFRFQRPCPASGSAVLQLDRTRLQRADTRHAILMDDTIVIGSQRQAHLPHHRLPAPLVLQLRSGSLLGRLGSEQTELPWGETVELAGIPITVVPA